MGPPNALRRVLAKTETDTDFVGTAVLSATIVASRPDGTTVIMSCTLSAATPAQVTVTRAIATTDFTVPGVYRARIHALVSGGELLSERFDLIVEAE